MLTLSIVKLIYAESRRVEKRNTNSRYKDANEYISSIVFICS